MTKKQPKTTNIILKLLATISVTIAVVSIVTSSILMIRIQQISDQQVNINLINSFKVNYTQSQLDNLRSCYKNGDTNCPDDKYNNSSVWKKQIDKLLDS